MKKPIAISALTLWFTLVTVALLWLAYGDLTGLPHHPVGKGLGVAVDSWLLIYACAIPPTTLSVLGFLKFGFLGDLVGNVALLVATGYIAVGLLLRNRTAWKTARLFVGLECFVLLLFLVHVVVSGPFYLEELRLLTLAGGVPSLLFHILLLWYLGERSPSHLQIAALRQGNQQAGPPA